MPGRHHRHHRRHHARHHRHSDLARVALALTGVALGACGDGSPTTPAPDLDRRAGVLQLEGASLAAATDVATSGPIRWSLPPGTGTVTPPQVIELPDTVRVRQSVDVIVRTVLPDG